MYRIVSYRFVSVVARRLNGVQLIADCFDFQDLPIMIAHSLITIVCNLKMWLNVRSIITMFIPLRSKVLRYMCNMSDKELRTPTIKLISGSYYRIPSM